ncbi:MAG: sigma-70 family RNA polymerase sigma factor [Actinophytocola sp.]|nr:sigma-70 family RNA polymerase sigma factor [Actinophytocola sp.]
MTETVRAAPWCVSALRERDAEAFAGVYRAHAPGLFRYLVKQLRDRSTAEDLTSETFVRALRGSLTLRESTADIRPWLVRIARNVLVDHWRAARTRQEIATVVPESDRYVLPDPATTLIEESERRRVLACLDRLNKEQRECLRLRFLHERSVAETAKVMARQPGAVRALQYRALRRLAELMADDQEEAP